MEANIEKLYLAFIEEKCHIHPTAPVSFEEEESEDYNIRLVHVLIDNFDCGLTFTDTDILLWLIKKDIRPSEVKEYDVEIVKSTQIW